MARLPLAVKYRPKEFEDITEQNIVISILKNQLETKDFQHAYLFTGSAGTGKTTVARIFANKINNNIGAPIEIDAASTSGVDNIRNIIDDARRKPIVGDYKIYIIDECHSLSSGAWQALLKLLEESPETAIFILCTTDPQKIPSTILSRVQRFNFTRISTNGIENRLNFILESENISITKEAKNCINYIAKFSSGGMRNAITLLDKCLSYSNELNLDNVIEIIGGDNYIELFYFTEFIINGEKNKIIEYLEKLHIRGKDFKQFVRNYLVFILNVEKYKICDDINFTVFPNSRKIRAYLDSINSNKINDILEFMLNLENLIKWDSDAFNIVTAAFISFCSGGIK